MRVTVVQRPVMSLEEILSLRPEQLIVLQPAFDAIRNDQLHPVFANVDMILTDADLLAPSPEPRCANNPNDAYVVFCPSKSPVPVLLIECNIGLSHDPAIGNRIEKSRFAAVILHLILDSLCFSLSGQNGQLAHYHPTRWASVAIGRCAVHGSADTRSMEDMTTSWELQDIDLPAILVSRGQGVLADAADLSFVDENGVQSVLGEVFGEGRAV
jgi:hypothetical protein